MSDQAQKLRNLMDQEPKKTKDIDFRAGEHVKECPAEVITITSGKGGVGKSNLAVNLGIALSGSGLNVAVADMDLGLANVNVITSTNPQFTLYDVAEGRREVTEIIEETDSGISIIAGASGEEKLANLSDATRMRMIEQLVELDEEYDVLIVDTSAGLSNRVMQFVRAADRTILVTTPEPTAITDAYGIIKAGISDSLKPEFNLVINRTSSILEGKKVAEKMQRVGSKYLETSIRILGYLTEDRAVSKAVRKRRPFYVEFPNSKAAQCIDHLRRRLSSGADLQQPGGIGGFFERITRWMGS